MLRLVDKAQQTDDDTYVPATMRQQTGFALPPELGALTESLGLGNVAELEGGSRRFVKNLDLPGLSTLNLISTARTGGNFDPNASVVTTAQNVAQQLAPHLRTGIEFLTQTDMHTKRPLGDVPTEIESIVGAATGNEDFRLPTTLNTAIDLVGSCPTSGSKTLFPVWVRPHGIKSLRSASLWSIRPEPSGMPWRRSTKSCAAPAWRTPCR
jgi:hypothetical protein